MNKSEIAERAARFEKLRQSVVQLASGNMAIAQMIDAEFGRFEERAIAESQAAQPNPNCPLCQGLGSWVEGEPCGCMKRAVLGDGEPSPLGMCSNWFPSHQGDHARRDNCVDWRSGAAQEVSPREPLCPMCCKPAIMPVPPSELEVRELKAALAKFVQNGKIRIKQLETMKELGLCQAGELAVWRVVCDDLEKLLG